MPSTRIATTRAQDLQPLAAAGQSGMEAWSTLHTLLARELSPAHAALLTEPVVNEAEGAVDWYAEGAGQPTLLQDLPAPARAAAQATLDRLTADIDALAARLANTRADADRFLSDMLAIALHLPGPPAEIGRYVYVRGAQPLLVGWAHVRSGGPGNSVRLTGQAAAAAAPAAILPPPPSPYGRPPPPRTWLWAALALALVAPILAGWAAVRDPFHWSAVDIPQCRLEPADLGLEQGLQQEVSREAVLRTELAHLSADAGQRRLMCPPIQPPAPPIQQAAIPPPPPPPASDDARRAERQGARHGKLQVILAWDDVNDLDLHLVCPNGTDINYIRRHACGGVLDVDANGDVNHLTPAPVENVYFDDPPPGHYRVVVDPYGMRQRMSTPFRVTIRRDGQPDQVTTGVAQNGQRMRAVADYTVEPTP